MAESLETLRAQRAQLTKAMRSGALSVRHGDKAVQYRSIEDMRTTLAELDADIAEMEGKPRKRVFYLNSGRGY